MSVQPNINHFMALQAKNNCVLRYILETVATSFGANVRRLREGAGLKGVELARLISVTPPVVSAWEKDRGGLPETPTLLKLAKALRCSVEDLLGGLDAEYDDARAKAGALVHDTEEDHFDVSGHTPDDIPIIGEGDASPQPDLFWDDEGRLFADVEDRITRPYDVTDPRAYGVRVRGDSMQPIYRPGQELVVSPNTPPADGDEVYVQLLNGQRLIKIAYRQENGWVLESANHAHPPRFVLHEEVGAIHPILWARRKQRGQRVVRDRASGRSVGRVAPRPIRERRLPDVDLPAAARSDDDDQRGDS